MAPRIRSNLGFGLLMEALLMECMYDLHVGMRRHATCVLIQHFNVICITTNQLVTPD
jgi:hypothetical protein